MSGQDTNAENSLCWTCKHGLCLKEVEQQTMIHDPTDGMPPGLAPPKDIFGEAGDMEEPMPPHVHHMTSSRVQAICFWRPDHIRDNPPIRVSEVKQCNRYDPKN